MIQSHRALFFEQLTYFSILLILSAIPFSKGCIEFSLIFGLVAWAAFRISTKNYHILNLPLTLPLLFYVMFVFISMINTPVLELSLRGLFRVLKYVALYLMVVDIIQTGERYQWVQRVILISTALACANGIYQMWTGFDFRHQYKILFMDGVARVTGSFNHPNNFAAYLTTVLLIFLYARDTKGWEIFKLIVATLCIFTLFQTYSRLPVILSLLVLIGVGFSSRQYKTYSFVCVLSFIIVGFAYCFYDLSYFSRMAHIIFGDARIRYWGFAVQLIKKHFLFGHGINTYMNAIDQPYIPQHWHGIYPHNFILQMWVELGLFGVFYFILFLVKFFIEVRNYLMKNQSSLDDVNRMIFGSIIAISFFLLHALVDNNLQSLQLTTLFWVLVGSVMGMIRKKDLRVYHLAPKVRKKVRV